MGLNVCFRWRGPSGWTVSCKIWMRSVHALEAIFSMRQALFAILLAFGLSACAGEFNPDGLDGSGTGIGSGTGVDETGTGMDETDGTDDGTTGDTDGGSTTGDDGTTGDETGGSTGGEMDPPGPLEPCDPFLAFNGEVLCDGDPEYPNHVYSCLPARTEPVPNMYEWKFLCIRVRDTQGDGWDIDDPCSDNGGDQYAGCFNSACTPNGLSVDPDTDQHMYHPPGTCSFGSFDTYLVFGCCTPFCNDENQCDPGWTCEQNFVPVEGVGACVWK